MQIIFEPHKSRPLHEFHEELRFEFPDLPAQLFDYYLVKAARQMAGEGKLIRRQAVIEASHGVTRYRLESPDGLEICGVLDIRSVPHCSCLQTAITRSFAPPEGAFACGREIAWFDDAEGVLHVRPPYCQGMYYVTLAVTPAMGTCELPDKFYSDHLPLLLTGAKAYILLISGRPWTNLNLGNAYLRTFEQSIPAAAIETATHAMRGGVRMQFGRVL